ncbi:MAG TPA: tryptophan--tRNA ligase [Gemmatimonadales bacterium]|nr:tryptophan--tRNA ligase [Gemmatimonadales bacterium]
MRRVFSGIQPSGEMHIGNWLGAIRNYVALQDGNDCLYCVVDQHAITGSYDATTLASRTREMAISMLAAGVDPDRATLFVQSHVPQHVALTWLLMTIAPLGELERMTQFKDKAGRMESIPAGLLTYPVLMAADILVYRAEAVPVGEDQLQHLELAREVARRWNHAFGGGEAFFPEPQPILSPARRIIGLDGQAKMSKSLGNTIGVMESPEAIWQKLRPAMTDPARVSKSDPGTPEICNVHALHQHFSPPGTVEEVAVNCRTAAWGCIDCKKVLAANMAGTLAPMRERGLELRDQPGTVTEILGDGAATARAHAEATLAEVTERMGFLPEG